MQNAQYTQFRDVYFSCPPPQPPDLFEVSRCLDHTQLDTRAHPAGPLWTSDQLIAESATHTIRNEHKRRTSTPSARIEPAIPPVKQLQTYALDHTAFGIG